jgi:putative ABC transport system permease protein
LKISILYLFGVLALIVIVSACFNYNSLCVARSLSRAKEVGIRKVAGAGRSHIIWQFLVESVLMAVIALGFALTFLQFIKPAFYNLDPYVKKLFNLDENVLVYAIFIVFTVIVGIMAGLFPALVLSRFQPVHVLKSLTNLSTFSKFRLQRALLVIQFSLSLICIIFTIVAYRQFDYTMEADLGFQTENVLNVELQGKSYSLFRQSVAYHKNISAVSAASYLPGQGWNMGIGVKKAGEEESTHLDYVAVDANYIPAMGMQLLAGRNFTGVDSVQHEKFIIINQTAVEKLNLGNVESAVGQFIRIDEKPIQIIGVVKDFVIRRPGETIQPGALRNLANELRYANIHLTGNEVGATLQDLERAWRNLDAVHPFRYKFYDDALAASHVGYSIMMKIVGFAGFLSICIASFGLLGIAMYSTQSRVKELSIRKVLGAGTASLAMLLSKNFLQLILIAVLIGTSAGYYISHIWLQSHAYRVDIGPGTLLAGVVIILILTLLTVGVQVAKTVRTNPVDHLKME